MDMEGGQVLTSHLLTTPGYPLQITNVICEAASSVYRWGQMWSPHR